MASIISAGTTSGTSLNLSGDTSGVLQLATNGSTTAITVDTSQNVGIGTASPVFGSGSGVELYRAGIATYRLSSSGAGVEFRNNSGTGELEVRGAFPLVFGTNATERMRIDSSGNVGIGTSSPASFGALCTRRGISVANVTGSVSASFSDGANDTLYVSQDSALSRLTFSTLAFNTGTTERMRIDSSGNLLVAITATQNISGVNTDHTFAGTTSTGRWVCGFINSSASSPYGLAVNYTGSAPNATGNQFLFCRDTGGTRFEVRSNGGIANYSANNVSLSDEREKTNIELASSYLDKICAIPVKTFNYIDQNLEEDDGLTLGVVAQDVQKVAPELVMESNWAGKDEPEKMRLGIYQTDLQYALMKAIQELKAELDATKAEVAALKGVN
jgi:hypothetical protein